MLRKPKTLSLPSAPLTGATTVSGASTALKSAICLSTLTFDSRPWWQTIQRASGPRLLIFAPEGNVTSVRFAVAVLWQVVQVMTPAGALISLVTSPLVRNSTYPAGEWHLAQAASTFPASFQ